MTVEYPAVAVFLPLPTCTPLEGVTDVGDDTDVVYPLEESTRLYIAEGRRGGVTHVMHGRSRMTIDPCIPTMPGRSTSIFHRPGRHCFHQSGTDVRCRTSHMTG